MTTTTLTKVSCFVAAVLCGIACGGPRGGSGGLFGDRSVTGSGQARGGSSGSGGGSGRTASSATPATGSFSSSCDECDWQLEMDLDDCAYDQDGCFDMAEGYEFGDCARDWGWCAADAASSVRACLLTCGDAAGAGAAMCGGECLQDQGTCAGSAFDANWTCLTSCDSSSCMDGCTDYYVGVLQTCDDGASECLAYCP